MIFLVIKELLFGSGDMKITGFDQFQAVLRRVQDSMDVFNQQQESEAYYTCNDQDTGDTFRICCNKIIGTIYLDSIL